ncbi:hypothetical protein SAMN04487944_1245 [Gracilibacillus ureilyticus]|uniref:Uncharacterized protein n=1 Tax=Gracilibacillus ureilyticus TaxID=531814 RepID=A0A1H9VIG3_9BACI|nr:hypothetical protein [Gracilibacillus ureilyticus]SES21368.1 hypothetical protein SAMN04487944_1245 [Gracilibacillus ureilyticus]
MTSKFSAAYLIFSFLFIMVLLVGCTSEKSEDEPDMEEKPVAQDTLNENAEKKTELSNQEEKPEQESTDVHQIFPVISRKLSPILLGHWLAMEI